MENLIIIISVIAEMLLTSWMFDGLVHWSDHLHTWEKKMEVRLSERKNTVMDSTDDSQADIVNG